MPSIPLVRCGKLCLGTKLMSLFTFMENTQTENVLGIENIFKCAIDHITEVEKCHANEEYDNIRNTHKLFLAKIKSGGLLNAFVTFNNEMSAKDGIYSFCNTYVHRDCMSYVNLYIAIRSSNWNLRVAAIQKLAPLYHTYDRTTHLGLAAHHLATLQVIPKYILYYLQNGGFSASVTGEAFSEIALDKCHESLINLDVKQFVRRPNSNFLNKTAIYLPYLAACQKNLHFMTFPPTKKCPNTAKMSKGIFESDQKMCTLFMDKVQDSQYFNHTVCANRGLMKLFTTEITEGTVYHDLQHFYEIGRNCMKDYVSHRLLLRPSTTAPVHKKLLRTLTDIKTVKTK